jgi:hypothetical protein|eukprot:g3498.t1
MEKSRDGGKGSRSTFRSSVPLSRLELAKKRAKPIVKDVENLLSMKVEEEKCTIAILTAPIMREKGLSDGKKTDELVKSVKAKKAHYSSVLQETLSFSLSSLKPRERREVIRQVHKASHKKKIEVDDETSKILSQERVCHMCHKVKVECLCHEEVLHNARRRDECAVCGNVPIDGIMPLRPCGHRVVCDTCFSKRRLLRKCPIVWCRRDIDRNAEDRVLQSEYRGRHARSRFSSVVNDWRDALQEDDDGET